MEFTMIRSRLYSWPHVSSDMLVRKEKCLDKFTKESQTIRPRFCSWPQVSCDLSRVRKEKYLDKSEEFLTDPWGWYRSSESLSSESQELNVAGVSMARQADDLEDSDGSCDSSWWKVLSDSDDSSEGNIENVNESDGFLTGSLRRHGSSESSWWKVLTDSDISSEGNVENVDEFTEDLQMIPSILRIKPHELSDMGVRVIKENNSVEDSSWGEESTDSEFRSNNKTEHLDKHLSKQKYPRASYSRRHVVHRLSIDQSAVETLRSHLCMYKPPEKCVDCTNILLFGMIGAGKSSTINTFLSALDPDRRTMNCAPTGQHPGSVTLKLTSYKSNSLKFWDTAGWNSSDDPVKIKEVFRMILEGRVPLGTNLKDFNPDANADVIPENVIHGVAFIVNTFTMDNIKLDLLKVFQDLQNIAKNIYNIVIGTNFERLRIPAKSYNHIYENNKLKRKFAKLSDYIGMKKRTMFVISNEWKGYKIEKTKCVLALYILKNMVRKIDPGQDSSLADAAIGKCNWAENQF
ncbi:uncharacterized protein LOC119974368 isoform X3 [Scyliorhinus canicula]|uniref:uncharacterized protein LOC119974368 isoform X3 n=2 Tax=Scyliorhinus canicula TaxID=7830 RepID=UPI0018F50AF4|nr:uncharacterized protein LOC119974368 isoform X3 [Scyliorhinus canicula]